MIYFDACALLKFIKQERETDALRDWRRSLPAQTDLVTSELARLEIARSLLRAGVDHQRIPYLTGQALRGLTVVDLTTNTLVRAMTYRTARLGSLDALHLATADPFRAELTDFVTYDGELGEAAQTLGFPVSAPK